MRISLKSVSLMLSGLGYGTCKKKDSENIIFFVCNNCKCEL